MKKILIIIIALQPALAYATLLKTELKHENLMAYSTVTDADEKSRQNKLLSILKKKDIVGFIQSKDKPELRSKQLLQIEADLKVLAKRLQTGRYSDIHEVDVKQFDPATNTLTFSQPLNNYRQTYGSLQVKSRVFPQFYHMIFANGRLLNQPLQLDKKAAKKFAPLLKPGATLPLEIEFHVGGVKQDKNVLAAITKVRLLDAEEKSQTIYERTISKAPEKIIAESWLKDGITNPLIGIHAFAFYSYRLQDEFIESPNMRKHCKPNGMLGIHLKLDCLLPLDFNEQERMQLEINYVGGIIASLKLHTLTPLTERSKKSLINDIRGDLGINKQVLQSQDVYSWQKYGVNISFYNKRLNAAVEAAQAEPSGSAKFKPLVLMELNPQQMQKIYQEAGQQP
ncbi:hypothetical protein [Marinicella sp. W31]|uniref:hypothetical protein n=1 Tax=Marinicella sp. W31 TaxID=3023713 RepID=UPI003757FBB8